MQFNISTERKEFLDQLAEKIDDECKSYSEYVTENSDYAEPLFYSDWSLETANLRGDEAELVEKLFAAAKDRWGRDWENQVKSGYCDVECIGIHIESMEVCSFSIGEVEMELSEEVREELAKSTGEEIKYLQRQCHEGYLSDRMIGYAYLNHDYERWILRLNADSLAEELGIGCLNCDELRAKGEAVGYDIAMAQDIPFHAVDGSNDSFTERLTDAFHEAEDSYRQFSPFEFFAQKLNDAINSEEAWEAYEEGLAEGLSRAIDERLDAAINGDEGAENV